jgi:outer membrane protein assembly factor BamB
MRIWSMMVCAVIVAVSTNVWSNDWPQWRGADRTGKSGETGLLQQWPEDGPPLAWKVEELGGGYSSPAVADGKLFGLGNRDDDEVVWALNESDGSELWATKLGPAVSEGARQGSEGPGCTPFVDGDRLYVLGAGGALACLQTADGKIVWQKNLIKDFGGVLPVWRYSESPLIDGDKLICTPGAEDATVIALNKADGELIWKCKVPEGGGDSEREGGRGGRRGGGRGGRGGAQSGASYSSPIAIDFEGQRQYVQLTATALVGISADDGKLLWRYDRPANRNRINCATPIFHDGLVFAASAYDNGGGAVKLSKDGSGNFKADEVYFTNRMQNHHGGMVVIDDCLYGANGGNSGGMMACIDFATGELLWRDRKGPKGSVAYADGRIYLRGENGELVLIEPNRDEIVVRGRFDQPNRTRSPAWAHPVIANGKMYIRDQETLYCYDVKAK